MIKKFIDKLLGKTPKTAAGTPLGKRVEVPQAEHGIDLGLVDERAIKVVKTLTDAGHEAYIVGGAVRELRFLTKLQADIGAMAAVLEE